MDRPKLRRLERIRMRRGDEDLLVLRDPLALADPFAIDAEYEPVLDSLDGQRTLAQVRQSLLMRGVVTVTLADLDEFVAELGEVGLLDDDRFRELWAEAHERFVEQDVRAPRHAGLLYPDDPDQLRAWLAPALPEPPARDRQQHVREQPPGWGEPALAIVVPHAPVSCPAAVRRVLASLPAPEQFERVVVLATDHSPGLMPYAACDKDFETPLGPIAADLGLLAQLEDRAPWLLREQIRLRTCDPIEWAMTTLRGLWGDRCPPVVALACGQTRLTSDDGREHARELDAILRELLEPAIDRAKLLVWVVAELSHVGPAYGQTELPDPAAVEARDRAMLEPLLRNQPERLAAALMERPASERPSGAAALVSLAELLPAGYRATLLDYTLVPAPGEVPGWIGCPTIRITR